MIESLEDILRRALKEKALMVPPTPYRPVNYDLLYQYVSGRYPRILRRPAE